MRSFVRKNYALVASVILFFGIILNCIIHGIGLLMSVLISVSITIIFLIVLLHIFRKNFK